jgi:prepilin-type N-terminal cleavage/methylation domain-containing protein
VQHQTSAIKGFSLIELSVVVVIMSVISVLGLELASQFVTRRATDETLVTLRAIDQAIDRFFWVYGYLPCPASRTTSQYEATHGLATACTADLGGSVSAGMVPFRTLNLPPEMALDAYGSRITYYVTHALTSQAGFIANQPAGIEMRTGQLAEPCAGNCSVIGDVGAGAGAAYALVSHGLDKAGSQTKVGRSGPACRVAEGRIDSQNCAAYTGVGPLVNSPDNVLYDSRYNTGFSPLKYFDDLIVWRTRGQL